MPKKALIIILTLFIISGCSNQEVTNSPTSDEIKPESERRAASGSNVDVFDIPTIKTLFVIKSDDGSLIYEKADRKSQVLDTPEYGYQVEVIGEEGEWYQIKERVSRSFLRNGNMIHSTGWEVVNIPKQNVGELAQIKLRGADLYETYDKAPVKGKIELMLISEAEFNKARNKKESFLVKQEKLVSSEDSVLTVATGNGAKKVYVSTPDAEVEMQVYNYVGHITYLNAYLLGIGYYEGGEYKLYNATSGEEIISFNDYPEISPDGRYIVSMYTNPYDQSTDLQLHRVGYDKTIKKELEASFSNWMVALEPYEVYWVDDTTLVLKVIHSKAFWDETGNLNDDTQYLKMKIL